MQGDYKQEYTDSEDDGASKINRSGKVDER
jgi:hypothetical protein